MKNEKYIIGNLVLWVKRYDDSGSAKSSRTYQSDEFLEVLYDLVVVQCEKDPYLFLCHVISLLTRSEEICILSGDRLYMYELQLHPGKFYKAPSSINDFVSLIDQLALIIEDKKFNTNLKSKFLADRSMAKDYL